jgi:type IV pilus assembly protein PilB
LEYIPLTTEIMQVITPDQAWHYRIIPKNTAQREIELYADSISCSDLIQHELEILLDKRIVMHSVDSALIERTLNRFYLRNNARKTTSALDLNSDEFLVQLIAEAKALGSSDIHMEAYEQNCRIRLRIDGQLIERLIIKTSEYPMLVNKIKILSSLDIAEKRLPQDGRIFYNRHGNKFDIRVSILPALYGEKIVLRLLANDATHIDIEKLGFSPLDLQHYMEGIKRPHGILLISGPTGSGKTTTLYATLKILNKDSRNILTIEDPIEYTLPGINQVQVKENIGLDFPRALRTFLRQDPDIIMLGEIRDPETANIAIRAALTGHLVLSTIHTNSAWGTISRLMDMGIPSYLIANTLNTTVAQRLLRKLCPSCKCKTDFDPNTLPKNISRVLSFNTQYIPKGCPECYFTGYKGRLAIYEVIPIDHAFSDKIKQKDLDIESDLKSKNIKTLAENSIELFAKGETSFEEIYPLLFN